MRKLTDWLSSYLDFTKHSESPESFHYWTGVSMVAGALRRKTWIEMGYFQWSPNFFIFLVAPPAIVSKSTSANVGAKILMEVEGIHFGPSSVTWQALLDSFLNAAECYPMDNELLGTKMDMCCLTVVASELGTFFDPQNREMVDLLNDMWDGKDIPFIRNTRMDGEKRVVNPWINLLACTTPTWLADNVNNQFADGGFASRSIFVFAEAKRQLVAYPFTRIHNTNHGKLQSNLVADLNHIGNFRGPFTLTTDALEWGTQWYSSLYERQVMAQTHRYRGHVDRKQTHLHKLAMVISATSRDDMLITPQDLQEADRRLTALEADIPRVFASMNKEQIADFSGDFVRALMKCGGPIKREDFFRENFMNQWSYETFGKVIDSVVNSSLVVQQVRADGTYFSLDIDLLNKTSKRVKG